MCIIQDDEEDWLQESASMADIFQGSRLTIAVGSACDSSKGFLSSKRDVPRAVRVKHKDEGVEFFLSDYGNFQTDVEGIMSSSSQQRYLIPQWIPVAAPPFCLCRSPRRLGKYQDLGVTLMKPKCVIGTWIIILAVKLFSMRTGA